MSGLSINVAGNPIAYLNGLGKYSKFAVMEQSSKAGTLGRDAIRNEFEKATTEWGKEYKNGKLTAYKKPSKLGMRLSHKSKSADNPSNMKHFIQSMTHKTTGTTVIMGAFKGHKTLNIENGEIKGYGKYLPTITRSTIAILEKLNSGKKSKTYNKLFPKGSVQGQFRGKQSYKNRRWAEKGFAIAESQIKSEMTDKLLAMIANYELQKGQTA